MRCICSAHIPDPKANLPQQIRIIVDTHAHEKPNKKKKPHRGYAFVVFEREKDMRGKQTPTPFYAI